MFAQQTVLRQLEAILSIHKLSRTGNYVDALREVAKLQFLPLDPRGPDIAVDVFENLSPHVQACIPDLLKVALTCLDNVTDTDGSLRALRAKVCIKNENNLVLSCAFLCIYCKVVSKSPTQLWCLNVFFGGYLQSMMQC